MSKAKLEAAKELIQEKNYSVARAVLKTISNDPTAQKWLAQLNQIAPEQAYIEDPFADILSDQYMTPIPPPPPRQQFQQPVQYEYQSVTVNGSVWTNMDNKVNNKIAEMQRYGWEYVSQHERVNTGGWAGSRVIQFRRAKL